jgi:hypothetical protein
MGTRVIEADDRTGAELADFVRARGVDEVAKFAMTGALSRVEENFLSSSQTEPNLEPSKCLVFYSGWRLSLIKVSPPSFTLTCRRLRISPYMIVSVVLSRGSQKGTRRVRRKAPDLVLPTGAQGTPT